MNPHPATPSPRSAEAVLQELREALRRSAEETPPPFAPPVATPTPQTAVERLLGHVTELQGRWVITPTVAVSHRPVIGPVINWLLGRVNGFLLRAYVGPVVQQQIDFNGAVVRYAQHAYQMIRILQEEARYLRQETREYDHHAADATRRLAQLELAVQQLAEDVAALQAAASAGGELGARLADLEQRLRSLQGAPAGAAPRPPGA